MMLVFFVGNFLKEVSDTFKNFHEMVDGQSGVFVFLKVPQSRSITAM